MNTDAFFCMHIQRRPLKRLRGFSLIELLSVIAVISVMASLAVPALSSYAASSRRTKFLTDLSSLFETARQHAVSKNTYVWVALGTENNKLFATVIATKDGTSQGFGEDPWTQGTVNLTQANNAFTTVTRLVPLGDFAVNAFDGEQAFASTPAFSVPKPGGSSMQLDRSVQFSPSGEARINAGLKGTIRFKAAAQEGSMKGLTDTVQINGPTGFLKIQSAN